MTEALGTSGIDGLDALSQQVQALEAGLGGAAAVAQAFDAELAQMKESMVFAGREVNVLSVGIGRGLRSAFDGLIFDGMKLSDALKSVAQSMIENVYNVAMRPVQTAIGGAIANGMNGLLGGMFPFADGAGFAQGRVMPFAR